MRLLFQSTTREYIEFLRDNAPDSADPDITNWGAISYQLWLDEGGRTPTTMAEVTMALGASPGPCPELPMDAGLDGGTDAGADSGLDVGPGPVPGDDGGCGCSAPSSGPGGSVPFLAGCAALLIVLRRRFRL